MIGIFSDSHGDLQAFDAAYELLKDRGAKRFFFAGGRYADLDEWVLMRKERSRGGRAYSDADFLSDVGRFLGSQQAAAKPASFGSEEEEDFDRIKEKFIRTPERDCLQYRDPQVSKKAMDMLGSALCCIVHDKNDLDRDDLLNAMLFIHGKEGEPKVVQIGPRYFLTPGKLTGAAEQTCALITPADKNLAFSAFTLDGRALIEDQPIVLERRNKISVK